jgi:L-alanine-DL-glutamate epimerase-like enolase superfamily enzyme
MKITDVQTALITARWASDPSFPNSLHTSALIRVTADSGIDGWGEVTLGYFAPETVDPIVQYFKPVLLGRNPMDIAAVESALLSDGMWWARSGAGRSVISGIETALWDLAGKALNVPAYQLLGGLARERIPVYASGGPSVWPIEENVRKVELYRERGHSMAKLSTNFYQWNASETSGAQRRLTPVKLPHAQRAEKLVEALSLLRSRFGADLDLAIDGHQGGVPHPIPVTDAIAVAQAVEPFRLRFYEEPLSYRDLEGYVELARRTHTPIAGGESLCGVDAFNPLLTRGVHVVQPDVGFVGGVLETQRLLHHAGGFRAAAALHTGASIGPCFAASWHLAAASTDVAWLEIVEASRDVRERFLADPCNVEGGTLAAPSHPGLGLRITPELLREFAFTPGSGERT